MKVIVTNSYDESCAVVAGMIRDLVNAKPNAKLGLATGGTPVPIYQKLAAYGHVGREDLGVAWEKTDRADALRAALGL